MKLYELNKAESRALRARDVLRTLDRVASFDPIPMDADGNGITMQLDIVFDPALVKAIVEFYRSRAERDIAEATAKLNAAGIELEEAA